MYKVSALHLQYRRPVGEDQPVGRGAAESDRAVGMGADVLSDCDRVVTIRWTVSRVSRVSRVYGIGLIARCGRYGRTSWIVQVHPAFPRWRISRLLTHKGRYNPAYPDGRRVAWNNNHTVRPVGVVCTRPLRKPPLCPPVARYRPSAHNTIRELT